MPVTRPDSGDATLFAYALRLHRMDPDVPLRHDGSSPPDRTTHHKWVPPPDDHRQRGADVAVVLDAHFADPDAEPKALLGAFCGLYVPSHRNDHIAAAALRAVGERVRATGRHLVRHATEPCTVTVGLALLAMDGREADVPLIQTIGLLSDSFASLAAEAVKRVRSGTDALLWLAQRTTGWKRVYFVEELCRHGPVTGAARDWLLRHSCDASGLDGYYAGIVATVAHLRAAIAAPDADDELVDHTGRLLWTMTGCSGMGPTLGEYPDAPQVVEAHVGHLARQAPSGPRFAVAVYLAHWLANAPAKKLGVLGGDAAGLARAYVEVLDREEWCPRGLRGGPEQVVDLPARQAAGAEGVRGSQRLKGRVPGTQGDRRAPRAPTGQPKDRVRHSRLALSRPARTAPFQTAPPPAKAGAPNRRCASQGATRTRVPAGRPSCSAMPPAVWGPHTGTPFSTSAGAPPGSGLITCDRC